MQVADVEAADALLGDLVVADVAVVAADPLVAAGAERFVAGPGEDDRRDLDVVACARERVAKLGQRLRAERVVDLGPVDRDPGDRLGALVEDVLVLGGLAPLDRRVELVAGGCVLVRGRHGPQQCHTCIWTTGSPSVPRPAPIAAP